MTQEKFTAVESILSSLSTSDIIRIWNDYCDDCSYDRVEYMDDFDELWHDSEPLWLIQRAFYGSFNPNDDYYVLNGYGNFVSFSYWDDNDSPICMDDGFVDWVIENYNERDEYISEDDIADAFVEYINKNKPGEGNDLTLDEIYELADNRETYDLDTILNDDWDMWLANVSDALGNQEEE